MYWFFMFVIVALYTLCKVIMGTVEIIRDLRSMSQSKPVPRHLWPYIALLVCLSFSCASRQAKINRLHTAIIAEQQVVNRDGRGYESENEVVDRYNRECLSKLAQLEK